MANYFFGYYQCKKAIQLERDRIFNILKNNGYQIPVSQAILFEGCAVRYSLNGDEYHIVSDDKSKIKKAASKLEIKLETIREIPNTIHMDLPWGA